MAIVRGTFFYSQIVCCPNLSSSCEGEWVKTEAIFVLQEQNMNKGWNKISVENGKDQIRLIIGICQQMICGRIDQNH
jgi:hypothetical protein